LDVVIDISPRDAGKIPQLFSEEEFYCPPLDVLRAEVVHHGQFNLIHQVSGLKIDMVIRKNTAHATTEFSRRRKMPFWQNHEAYVASPEDVVIKKLDYFREGGSEKHLRDIRGILAETPLDQDYLTTWIRDLALQQQWQRV
jgi:hypothetical protein